MTVPKKRPRRSKLTQAVRDRIVHAVKNGNTYEVASRYGGVDPSSFHGWMRLGEKSKKPSPHRELYELITAARADAVTRNIYIVQQAGVGVEVVKTVTKTYQQTLPGASGPVTVTEVTETRSKEFDWRASAWWLERMERQTFGKIRMDPVPPKGDEPPDDRPAAVKANELRERLASRISGIASRIGAVSHPAGSNGNGASHP